MTIEPTTEALPSVLATPEWRVEGEAKVTGQAHYVADLEREGMLHVAFLRSPYPHARIVSLEAERARSMPGVRLVVTGEDFRPARLGRRLQDWPVLAWDVVRMVGDRVAAVVAETPAQAEAAVREILVEYEELRAVFDPEDALLPDAPILHPDADEYAYHDPPRPPRSHPNIQGRSTHEHGDVDAAFAGAAHVFEHAFETARTYQGHLEPRASLVWMDGDTYHVKSTNKSPFLLRRQLATSLGVPVEQVVVDSATIGGDFGGKGFVVDEFALVRLARLTGRPVRSVTSYTDDMRATNTRHASRVWLRTGLDADGRIVAHEARAVFNGGAYTAAKNNVGQIPGGSKFTLAGYRVPNVRVESISVYTNSVPGGHARAPGQPQVSFAAESHVDLICRALGIDPIEFRIRNAVGPGDMDALGREWRDPTMATVLETLRREAGWDRPTAPGHGRGVAMGARSSPSGGVDATVVLTVTLEGRVDLLASASDQGCGSHTMMQRVVAAELGVAPERVVVRHGDTSMTSFDLGAGGSRVTPVVGGAAQAGARALRARLEELAPGRDLQEQLTVAGRAGDVRVDGRFKHVTGFYSTYAFAVEVAVDGETGQVQVVDCCYVADVGTVINPLSLRGQLVGGFASGFGQALMEDYRVEDGIVVTANLGDYRMPTMADVPPIRIVLLPGHPGGGPFGSKGAGEVANISIAPAIANAVADAVGVRITSLPITAEKVFTALRAAEAAAEPA